MTCRLFAVLEPTKAVPANIRNLSLFPEAIFTYQSVEEMTVIRNYE